MFHFCLPTNDTLLVTARSLVPLPPPIHHAMHRPRSHITSQASENSKNRQTPSKLAPNKANKRKKTHKESTNRSTPRFAEQKPSHIGSISVPTLSAHSLLPLLHTHVSCHRCLHPSKPCQTCWNTPRSSAEQSLVAVAFYSHV